MPTSPDRARESRLDLLESLIACKGDNAYGPTIA